MKSWVDESWVDENTGPLSLSEIGEYIKTFREANNNTPPTENQLVEGFKKNYPDEKEDYIRGCIKDTLDCGLETGDIRKILRTRLNANKDEETIFYDIREGSFLGLYLKNFYEPKLLL